MVGLENRSPLSVSSYAVTWRIEVVDDDIHRGYEYVRSEPPRRSSRNDQLTLHVSFYWGTTRITWELPGGVGTRVRCRVTSKNYY